MNNRPPNAGMGRKPGSQNKMTKALKDMILGALSDVGGQSYLARQAEENPVAFMTLIGKVLPSDINVAGKDGGSIVYAVTPEKAASMQAWTEQVSQAKTEEE